MVSEELTDFDMKAADLVVETKNLRNEARQLGHEKLALRLGLALNRLVVLWKDVIAAEEKRGEG